MHHDNVSYLRVGAVAFTLFAVVCLVAAGLTTPSSPVLSNIRPVAFLLVAALWAFHFYLDSKTRAAGHITESRPDSDPKYAITSLSFFGAIIGPVAMLAIDRLGHQDLEMSSALVNTLLGVSLLATLLSLASPTILAFREKEPLPAALFVALSVGSFILWIGGPAGFGFLTEIFPAFVTSLIYTSRYAIIIVVAILIGALFVLEFLRRTLIDPADFIRVRDDWHNKQNEIADRDYESAGLSEVSRAVFESIAWLIITGSRYASVAWRVARSSAVSSIESIFDRRRLGLSLVIVLLIWANLFIALGAQEFIYVLSRAIREEYYDQRILVLILLLMAWSGAMTIAHARTCFVSSRGIYVQTPRMILLVSIVIWLLAVLIYSVSVSAITSNLTFGVDDYFIILFPLALTLFGGIWLDRRRWLCVGLAVAGVAGWLLLVFLNAENHAAWPGYREVAVPLAAQSEVTVLVEADNQSKVRPVPTSNAAEGRVGWVYGRWGLDGGCTVVVAITQAPDGLRISYSDSETIEPVVRVSDGVVQTEHWVFTRVARVLRATVSDVDLGVLRTCPA